MSVLRDGRSGIQPELLTRPQDLVGGNPVHAGEGMHSCSVAMRDAPQGVAASDNLKLHVASPAGETIYSCCGEPHFLWKNVRGRRHFEIVTHREPPAGHSVDSAQKRDTGLEASRDRIDRVPPPDNVVLNSHALFGCEVGDVLLEHRCRIDRQQQIEGTCRIAGPTVKGWIEPVNLASGDTGDLGRNLQIDLTADWHLREVGLVWNWAE